MTVLANAAAILRCFSSDCTELTVTDVATRLDMPKANASRLMKAMREAGLLETIGDSKRHRPGRMLLDISAAFRGSSPLILMAADVVTRVSADCGHTGYVSVLLGREVTAITDTPGSNTLRVVSNIGRRLSAHAAATGRALLARLSDAEVRKLFPTGLPGGPTNAPTEMDDLFDRLRAIRSQGYALSNAEATPGVDAISVAVSDPRSDETVALCIVFPAAVVGQDERSAILRGLMRGAAEIAARTGDPVAAQLTERIPA
ncbi:IclR family transcriptional regulator [Gemmobacter sp.]|uniref:IclR family transcriptional regulator n=1 Tax=Gemmobacter sp. TaxID=1898957 RepID=UPI002B001DEE|nr:IclR family transcriptional regulator [Gemmobacter sp.]